MVFTICASTPKSSVEVVRADPAAALAKISEFEDLGITEVAITTDAGQPMTREQLRDLAAPHEGVAA